LLPCQGAGSTLLPYQSAGSKMLPPLSRRRCSHCRAACSNFFPRYAARGENHHHTHHTYHTSTTTTHTHMKPFLSNRALAGATNPFHSRHHRGFSSTLVLGIVAAVVVIGALIYFVSPVRSTQVNEAVKKWVVPEWTAENIVKRPTEYFTWVIAEANKQQELIAARLHGLKFEKAKVAEKVLSKEKEVASFDKIYLDAKVAYKELPDETVAGKTGKKFPFSFKGREFETEKEFAKELRKVKDSRERAAKIGANYKITAGKIDKWLENLDEQAEQLKANIATADANLEFVKTKQTIEGIGAPNKAVADMFKHIKILANESDPKKISLIDMVDDIVKQEEREAANDAILKDLLK